ncbi:MAG: UbiD family decarboxylase [Nitrososphaerales archaeon]
MPRADLRSWMDQVQELGLMREVKNADWNLEIGVLTELNARSKKHTLLFDEIKGYSRGFRVLTGAMLDSTRVALTLGLPTDTTDYDLVKAFKGRLSPDKVEAISKDYPPKLLSSAPFMENVRTGDQVNMLEFPSPKWHELDGGRYIGTADCVITRDPNSDWVNVGAYRIMVHNEKELGIHMSSGHHGRLHMMDSLEKGEKFPIAISFGQHPLLFAVAGLEVPQGVSEYNYAGASAQRSLEVMDGPITGLPIPADAEIVVEGYVTGEMKDEGPFGEFMGYYAGGRAKKPVIKVEAVYYRNDPIILGTAPGRPPYDYSYFRCPLRAALIWDVLEKAGISGIKGVWCHEAGYSRALTVISLKQAYGGHAKQAGYIATQCRLGAFGRYVIVVDEDIDPTNLYDVMWAVCSRTDPATSIDIIKDTWNTPLDPMTEKSPGKLIEEYTGSRAMIFATKPISMILKDTFPKVAESSPEVQAKFREKWKNLLD